MHVTYYDLNQYVVVPIKNIKDSIENYSNEDDINALCVPFYGSLSFLDEELKPFRSWDLDNPGLAFLVKDIEKCTFDVPNSEWNRYVLYGVDTYHDQIIITSSGFKYCIGRADNTNYLLHNIIISEYDVESNNSTILTKPTTHSSINNISIYSVMYGINKFANICYKKSQHHGLEKAGIPAKKASHAIQEKVKDTKGKAKLHLVPQQILYDIAEVREYGNKKYPTGGEDNWKLGDPKDYLDAAYRHLTKMVRDGIDSKDKESGIEHYKHLATNVAFICGFMGGEHENV